MRQERLATHRTSGWDAQDGEAKDGWRRRTDRWAPQTADLAAKLVGDEGHCADEMIEGDQRRLGGARQWADHNQRWRQHLRVCAESRRLLPPQCCERRVVQRGMLVRAALNAVLTVKVRHEVVEALSVSNPVHELGVWLVAGPLQRGVSHKRCPADLTDEGPRTLKVALRVRLVAVGENGVHSYRAPIGCCHNRGTRGGRRGRRRHRSYYERGCAYTRSRYERGCYYTLSLNLSLQGDNI